MKLMDCPQDAASNMTSRIAEANGQPTVTETRTVNALNQITANSVVVSGGGTTNWTYTHDSNGNMLSKSNGTDTWSYQWNDERRLTLVTLPGGATVAYTWDGAGRMLTRTDSSGTTRFVWDGQDCIQETDYLGNVTRYYIPSGSSGTPRGAGLITSFDRNGAVFQVHCDGLGSVRMVTSSSGTVVAQFDTDAWGNSLASSFDNVPNGGFMYRFVGAVGVRWDAATGLYFMRQRWYDPSVNRFVTRDPMRGMNLYAYAGNSPTTAIDPFGMAVQWGQGTTQQEQNALQADLKDITGCPGGTIGQDIQTMLNDPSYTIQIQMVNSNGGKAGGTTSHPPGQDSVWSGISLQRNAGTSRFADEETLAHELYHALLTYKNRKHIDCMDSQIEELSAEDYGQNVVARAIQLHGQQWNIKGVGGPEPNTYAHLYNWFSGNQSNTIGGNHWNLMMGPSSTDPGSATYLSKPQYPTDGTTFPLWKAKQKCPDAGTGWIFQTGWLK